MTSTSPSDILAQAYERAETTGTQLLVADEEIVNRINSIARSRIGAGVRVLLACSLAKAYLPSLDIRKPYADLGEGAYSGRSYDERYIAQFINQHKLPCNSTTAFLTPALRTKSVVLTAGTNLGGRDAHLYADVISVLEEVENETLDAFDLLTETIRVLLLIKAEREENIAALLRAFQSSEASIPLSSEDIVNIIDSHLRLPLSARLLVLVVTAAYEAASSHLAEKPLPLQAHNAADERTGSLGDVEIALTSDDKIVTVYEMKMKAVTKVDLDRGLQKLHTFKTRVDNYIFITTDVIDKDVADYAADLYRVTGGIEFVVLDCIGFLRHYLHLFHRLRIDFLNAYQNLLLAEPESAVRQSLKEAFLALRNAAESSYGLQSDEDF